MLLIISWCIFFTIWSIQICKSMLQPRVAAIQSILPFWRIIYYISCLLMVQNWKWFLHLLSRLLSDLQCSILHLNKGEILLKLYFPFFRPSKCPFIGSKHHVLLWRRLCSRNRLSLRPRELVRVHSQPKGALDNRTRGGRWLCYKPSASCGSVMWHLKKAQTCRQTAHTELKSTFFKY